jgi:Ca2+-transporting ATPase
MTVTVLDIAGNRLDLKSVLRDFSPTVRPGDVQAPVLLEDSANTLLLLGGALCNDASLEPVEDQPGSFSAIGDPTEGALVISAAQAGLWKDDLQSAMPRLAELPFDSERKRMTTVHSLPAVREVAGVKLPIEAGTCIALTKGAVDNLLEISSRVWVSGKTEPLSSDWRLRIQTSNDELAGRGMRVLGVGFRLLDQCPSDTALKEIENDLVFVGMLGMIDPARPEAKEAIRKTQTAGIRTVMITGDHPLTALHISEELGITRRGEVLTGNDLAGMSVTDLEQKVDSVSVFARVAPEHKLKIVDALQARGHIVAMTGDGVNDAPALKTADIGVAMGIVGTDVSKEASDMILLDDNFATIVNAIEEGRRIYDNIRKFVRYTMTSNAGEIWVMLAAPFLGMPLPLLPLQILWVNLVTDGLPGLALSIEPAEKDTMQRPPRSPKENIFARGMARDVLWIGLLMGLVSLAIGIAPWRSENPAWQTMIFTTLTMAQMGNALAIRSERFSLFQIGLRSNLPMVWAVLSTLALQLVLIYAPFAQNIFETVPLTFSELALCLLVSSFVFIGVELFKFIQRLRNR